MQRRRCSFGNRSSSHVHVTEIRRLICTASAVSNASPQSSRANQSRGNSNLHLVDIIKTSYSSVFLRSPHIVKLDLRLVRTMASSLRPASRLVARPLSGSSILRQVDRSPFFCATAQFHTTSPRNALPAGPPPSGYRLPRPKRFYEGENAINKASNYFLLTEMMRGMYVVLEQFFRAPYVSQAAVIV